MLLVQKEFGKEIHHWLEYQGLPVIVDDTGYQQYECSDNGVAGDDAAYVIGQYINQHERKIEKGRHTENNHQ